MVNYCSLLLELEIEVNTKEGHVKLKSCE